MTAQGDEALAVPLDRQASRPGDSPAQADVVRAFAAGLATGEAPLDHVVTHMSHIFLGRERAYKLARARAHGFGDFTTLAARRAACLAEFTLNRALAPALYEAFKPVRVGPGGKVHIGGGGRLIDWVIIMRRFAPGALFSELARDQHLTADHVVSAVDAVIGAHRAAAPLMDGGGEHAYGTILEGLRKSHAAALASGSGVKDAETLFKTLGERLHALAPLLERRRQGGWTRRGHGDLHLRNICVFEGRVTLFDALAFDETLATGDVLYDLAFLLMDLQARDLAPYANLAMNHYWDKTQQPEWALALLATFMALRAVVRMTVAEEAGDGEEAALYHRLAVQLLDRPHPRLLTIGGLSGSGKSTIAKLVAPTLPGPCGARVLRTDIIRKLARSDAGREYSTDYTIDSRRAVYQRLTTAAEEALVAGASVVADATFADSLARDKFSAAFAEQFAGVWLRASQATRLARVEARRSDASEANATVVLSQIEPVDLGPKWLTIEAEGSSDQIAERVAAAARAAPPAKTPAR